MTHVSATVPDTQGPERTDAVRRMREVPRGERFTYVSVDLAGGQLTCRYDLDGTAFTEVLTLDDGADLTLPGAAEAARLYFLLAGVSYYKATAARSIDYGTWLRAASEAELMRRVTVDGLAEYAHRLRTEHGRLDVDLDGVEQLHGDLPAGDSEPPSPLSVDRAATAPQRPLVPFGGGMDSIVTVEGIRHRVPDLSLFVWGPPGARFEAIDASLAVTGLPVVRAERQVDPALVAGSREGRYLNGHVPVTGVLSAAAVLVAAATGHDAVVMSNEWSASSPSLRVGDREVNHQWSKSETFETAFRAVLADAVPGVDYFSWLRARSELWVAERLSHLPEYLAAFRSCNRSFRLEQSSRSRVWCGRCDKCAFIDLVLAPFVPAERGAAIFTGSAEPLRSADAEVVRALWSLVDAPAPTVVDLAAVLGEEQAQEVVATWQGRDVFECVGDVHECRTAALVAAERPDRADDVLLQLLARSVRALGHVSDLPAMLEPMSTDHVPDALQVADDGPGLG